MNIAVDISVEESGKKKPQYTLETDINGELSLLDFLEFTKSTLIITADTVLKEEQSFGFDKRPVVIVDNSAAKPVINVSPLGSIEFVARASMDQIILETYQALTDRSKVLTGRYIKSHYVFLNGTQVANDLQSLQAWIKSGPAFNDNDLIRFVNIQPYARKLERLGVTAQRSQQRSIPSRNKHKKAMGVHIRVPNGVYFLTTRSIRAKYKRNSVIKFAFISGQHLGITGSFKASRNGKPGRSYLYPSITISVKESGIA